MNDKDQIRELMQGLSLLESRHNNLKERVRDNERSISEQSRKLIEEFSSLDGRIKDHNNYITRIVEANQKQNKELGTLYKGIAGAYFLIVVLFMLKSVI